MRCNTPSSIPPPPPPRPHPPPPPPLPLARPLPCLKFSVTACRGRGSRRGWSPGTPGVTAPLSWGQMPFKARAKAQRKKKSLLLIRCAQVSLPNHQTHRSPVRHCSVTVDSSIPNCCYSRLPFRNCLGTVTVIVNFTYSRLGLPGLKAHIHVLSAIIQLCARSRTLSPQCLCYNCIWIALIYSQHQATSVANGCISTQCAACMLVCGYCCLHTWSRHRSSRRTRI